MQTITKPPINSATSLTPQYPKPTYHSSQVAQTLSQTVLPSQDVRNPTTPTATSNNSSLHIPLNALSLYQKTIPLLSNSSLDSNQSHALSLMDLTLSRPIIAH
jgi:hypothetical protein